MSFKEAALTWAPNGEFVTIDNCSHFSDQFYILKWFSKVFLLSLGAAVNIDASSRCASPIYICQIVHWRVGCLLPCPNCHCWLDDLTQWQHWTWWFPLRIAYFVAPSMASNSAVYFSSNNMGTTCRHAAGPESMPLNVWTLESHDLRKLQTGPSSLIPVFSKVWISDDISCLLQAVLHVDPPLSAVILERLNQAIGQYVLHIYLEKFGPVFSGVLNLFKLLRKLTLISCGCRQIEVCPCYYWGRSWFAS